MHRPILKRALLLIALLGGSPVGHPAEELVIIVHPDMRTALSQEAIRRIYLGKPVRTGGVAAPTPVMIKGDKALFDDFARTVMRRSPQQLKAWWAKRLFTGRSDPPVEADSADQLRQWVASKPGHIGYLPASLVDDSVRVIPIGP